MVLIAAVIAIVVAFLATYLWASVDAKRSLSGDPAAAAAPPNVPRVTLSGDKNPDEPTTTKPPEILSEGDLAKKVAASVRAVSTLDDAGQPVQGTAFVVGSFSGQTYLLTSFAVVKASTRSPGPGILISGNQQATLWTWQEERDLALLVVNGQIESLPWASVPPKQGEKIWAGGAGQKLAAGVALNSSDTGIDHNIFVDDVRQGAPLVTQKGEVVGMVSRLYNPSGKGTDSLYIAVPIRISCERMLRCGGGNTVPGVTPTTRP